MVTLILGWYARKLYDRWKASRNPPVKPEVVYEGEITLNQPSAGPMSTEQVLGEYNPETGCREIIEDAKKVPQSSRLTTWFTDDDGLDKISLRWEKRSGRFRLGKARKGEVWRIEFYKVRDADQPQTRDNDKPSTHAPHNTGANPFGGGGVFN